MIILDDVKHDLGTLAPEVHDMEDALAIPVISQRYEELTQQSSEPGFFDDPEKSREIFAQMSAIKGKLEKYEMLKTLLEDAETFVELAEEDGDEALLPEAEEHVEKVQEALEELRLIALLSGQYDDKNAILTFHAGAGGTEAQDWVSMLYRMYSRFAVRHGFTVDVLDYLDGDEAGIKSASIMIKGVNAFGFLKGENGVHRLVRISPFDSSGRRHTSFASLEVMPEIDDNIEIEIRPEDIRMEVFRSSGAGGQHINKTSSAVRLIHLPTGIVVACQNERSQFQNRDMAMKMLKSKLFQVAQREHLEHIEDIKGEQLQIAWGSQIRSYVFMPYTLVKDHRTSYETGNINAVMDGEIDGFINAYLKAASHGDVQER
ncbi:MAG: peptide chain release factor 2 [Pygmaiobacter sp.]